ILPPNSFQVFTLKHPSALDGHTHSTAPTHTVPKHTGPSSHSFIPQVGTPHVCAPHTVPSTIVDFHGHTHTHPPNAYGPPPSTLHWFFHLFTINQLWPMLVSSMLWLGRSFGGVG